MARTHKPSARSRQQREPRDTGSSLVELLVAGSICGVIVAGMAPLYSHVVRNFNAAEESVDLQLSLQADLSQIRQLGERYSWCSGEGSINPSGASCSTTLSGNASYYVPSNSAGSTAVGSELASFTAACAAGSGSTDALTAPLVQLIASLPQPQGLSRAVSLDDASAHRLRILYTGANLSRSVVYTPPVVAFCP